MMRIVQSHRASGILYRFIKQYGGRYLLPANVCPIVPLTFKLANVDFEFVDIDEKTLCVDEEICLNLLKQKRCDGLVFVHTYGTEYYPQQFFHSLKEIIHDFRIIDDKCLCAPDMVIPETDADLTLYSTGYAKYVDLGGGAFGFIKDELQLSKDAVVYDGSDIEPLYKDAFQRNEKIEKIGNGWLDAFVTDVFDGNYCFAVAENRDRIRKHKEFINAIYSAGLKGVETIGDNYNQWRFNILVDNKEQVLRSIFDAGLFASSHYQPSSKLFVEERFPNAEKLYGRVINLFNDKYMDFDSARKLTSVIRNHLRIDVDCA